MRIMRVEIFYARCFIAGEIGNGGQFFHWFRKDGNNYFWDLTVKSLFSCINGMFSIKFPGPVIFSVIFSPKFLACASLKNYEKTRKISTDPLNNKYDAKHWSIFLALLRTIWVSESVNFIEKLDQRYNPRRLNLVHNDKFVIVEYYIFNSHWKRKVFISSFLSPHKRFAKTTEHVWYVLENQYFQDVLVILM